MLLRQWENTMRDGSGIDKFVESLVSGSDLFNIYMRKERELLNINTD